MPISIRSNFKRIFFAVLLISIPLITFLVIWWFFKFFDGLIEPFYYQFYGYHIPELDLISAVILVFIIATISIHFIRRKHIKSSENIMIQSSVFRRATPSSIKGAKE